MSESEINIDNVTEHTEWLLTDRPFEKDRSEYDSYELSEIDELYGSWDKTKYPLGFQEEDLTTWIKDRSVVLEVGPGEGVGFEQLANRGIDIYALEPSLKYSNEDPVLERAKERFSRDEFRGRVSAANAADAALAFPRQRFQVAFAIGPNFQNHSTTEAAFVNQIIGVMSALTPTEDSFFSFQVNDYGEVQLNIQRQNGKPSTTFELTDFLRNNGIRYTLHDYFSGSHGSIVRREKAKAIRIYKQSADGQDAVEKLIPALRRNLGMYRSR